jgi:hypothetical protein
LEAGARDIESQSFPQTRRGWLLLFAWRGRNTNVDWSYTHVTVGCLLDGREGERWGYKGKERIPKEDRFGRKTKY